MTSASVMASATGQPGWVSTAIVSIATASAKSLAVRGAPHDSAGPRGRTAASHWALSGAAARPECAAQPRAWRARPGRPGR
eukprot:scaffold73584_cov69-Phaeocystis_antarctica.AAC.2